LERGPSATPSARESFTDAPVTVPPANRQDTGSRVFALAGAIRRTPNVPDADSTHGRD
jgi:hypothetical protein